MCRDHAPGYAPDRITLAYGEHLAGSFRGVPRSPPGRR